MLLDVYTLTKSYRKGEVQRIGWIPGRYNAADVLTKEVLSQRTAMWKLIITNKLDVDAFGWATRTGE